MTRAEMIEVARGNIERNLGADFEEGEEPSADAIYSDAYTLGVDALMDKGVDAATARDVAREVAQGFAQP